MVLILRESLLIKYSGHGHGLGPPVMDNTLRESLLVSTSSTKFSGSSHGQDPPVTAHTLRESLWCPDHGHGPGPLVTADTLRESLSVTALRSKCSGHGHCLAVMGLRSHQVTQFITPVFNITSLVLHGTVLQLPSLTV